MSELKVGMRVRALVSMDNDLREDGMGIQRYANKGDELIVREIDSGYLNCISVSHDDITNSAFCVAPTEIEVISGGPQ